MNKSFKKIISVIMSLVLAMGILAVYPVAATADIAVKTDRSSCIQGDTVVATVYFPAEYNKISSLDLVMTYDAAKFEVISVEDGAGLENAIKAQINGRVYSENHSKAGQINWSLAATNNFDFKNVFSVVTFKVRPAAVGGNTTLGLTAKKAANSGRIAMTVNTQGKTIEIIKTAESKLTYKLASNGKGYEVTGYNSVEDSSLTIPATYADLPVTGIADSAFKNHGELKTVSLPTSLQSIGANAFSGCSGLTKITVPDSVNTIGAGAFKGCAALESVTLPVGLKTVEKETFADCSYIEKVEIPFTVTKINAAAFKNCYALQTVKISKNTTSIAADAFSECFPNLVFKTVSGNTYLPTYIKNYYKTAKITEITDYSLGTATLSATTMQYTGKALVPTVTVKLKSGASVNSRTDYKVVYKNNIEKGTATVYVAALGDLGEGYVLTFKITCTHTFDKKVVGKAATCTTDGYYNKTCKTCGEVVQEKIPATGHKEGSYIIDRAPTIFQEGMKHTECTVCGAIIKNGVSVAKVFPDLNNDKRINSSDALIVLQYSTGMANKLTTDTLKLNADTNGDGKINSTDALDILQIAIGKTTIDGYTV